MALHIAFEKSADTLIKKIVKTFAGPYVHTELIVSRPVDGSMIHTAYSAYMSETFARTAEDDFWFNDECHDFLSVAVTSEELHRIRETCEACVKSKIPYNTVDMVFSQIPLRNPKEAVIYDSKALFCSQAAVLVLRSCLDKAHKLHAALDTVNSRTVSPSHLYEVLRPLCVPKVRREVMKSVL